VTPLTVLVNTEKSCTIRVLQATDVGHRGSILSSSNHRWFSKLAAWSLVYCGWPNRLSF